MLGLEIVAWVYMGMCILSSSIIEIDILMGRYQKMTIMNVVWPITGLYLGPFSLYYYFKKKRAKKHAPAHKKTHTKHVHRKKITLDDVFMSSLHCGAGCVAGDIVAELIIFFVGITLFGATIWASLFFDYGLALVFGLVFQFFTIKAIKKRLSNFTIIKDAFKADILSITTFEIGLFGWMIASFFIFSPELMANQVIFWFMMQVGMILGLLTTMPMNYLLIKWGIKSSCHE